MGYRKIIFASVALAVVGGAFVFSSILFRPSPSKVTLSFVGYGTNSVGQKVASFKFENRSKYSIVASDSCFTQRKKNHQPSPVSLHGTDLADIRLASGYDETITIVPPVGQSPWRLGVAHYPYDRINNLKMEYGSKPWVRRFIPLRVLSVRAPFAWSEWLTNDVKSN